MFGRATVTLGIGPHSSSYLDHTLKSGLTADSSALVPNCRMDISEPVPNCPDILDPSRWCRSVLSPKCLGSEVSVHL